MKRLLACAACLAIPVAAFADERITLVIGHPDAPWEVYCTINLMNGGQMSTQMQLSRDSMPAPFWPAAGTPFLADRFALVAGAIQAGTWPASVQEDEVRGAPYVSVVYSQRTGDDVDREWRIFLTEGVVPPTPVADLFAPLHDGGCLTPPS